MGAIPLPQAHALECDTLVQKASEGFLKGPPTCQPKDPSKPLPNASRALRKEGVEIDDVLGFPGLRDQFWGPGVLKALNIEEDKHREIETQIMRQR